jgi:hypothetical protein
MSESQKETYKKWKDLVNMSASELKRFMDSEEGKKAGLSRKEAKELGIHYGRESARWILKMKETPVSEWTPKMWEWANRQISFNSRMRGNKGKLYDDKGRKTRKYLSLLIWGHNPEKYKDGGEIDKKINHNQNIENKLNNNKNENSKENKEKRKSEIIEEAISYISRGVRAIEKKQSRSLSKDELKDLQSKLAFEFAKNNDLWIKSIDLLPMPIEGGGNENSLYYDEKNGIIYKSNNLFNSDLNIANYLKYILNHNYIFKNTKYNFVGFIGFSHNYENDKKATPYIEPVISQEFIIGNKASIEDIENYMQSIGFKKIDEYKYHNDEFIISDLRPRNVVKSKDGKIYVIDNIITKKDSNINFELGGEITLTTEQVEQKLGRKLHWWNDAIVTINGVEYKKVFLKNEYKRI